MVFVKNCNFSHYFLLYKLGGLNVFGDALGREIAFLDYKNKIVLILKGLVHRFCQKVETFLFLLFSKNSPNESFW